MDNRDLCRAVEPRWFYIEMQIMQIVNVNGALAVACMLHACVCVSRCVIEILQTSSYLEQNICAASNNNEINGTETAGIHDDYIS